jgi:phosphoribosylpyrophosphate synthetase
MATNSIKLLTGNSHPQLAKQVADRLVFSLPTTNVMVEGDKGADKEA